MCKETSAKLVLSKMIKQSSNVGNKYVRCTSPFAAYFIVENGNYVLTIDVKSSDKVTDYTSAYQIPNEGALEQFLLSVTFPIKIDDLYRKLQELSIKDESMYKGINIEVKRDGEITDLIHIFEGKVTQVRLASTNTSNVVTYSVIVDVANDDLKLKPGMTANVSIITDKSENVLCAPTTALKFTPNTDGTKYKTKGIWIMKKRTPERITIETGASDDARTEIISDKIKEGTKVIVGIKGKEKTGERKPRMRMF